MRDGRTRLASASHSVTLLWIDYSTLRGNSRRGVELPLKIVPQTTSASPILLIFNWPGFFFPSVVGRCASKSMWAATLLFHLRPPREPPCGPPDSVPGSGLSSPLCGPGRGRARPAEALGSYKHMVRSPPWLYRSAKERKKALSQTTYPSHLHNSRTRAAEAL